MPNAAALDLAIEESEETNHELELKALQEKLDEKLRKSRHSMRKACSKASRLGRHVREKPDSLRNALKK